MHDRIVALATREEIADFEIEKAACAARNKVLEEEEQQLRRLLARDIFSLSRRGDRYTVTAKGVSNAQVRAMFAAMKGIRVYRPEVTD